MARREIRFLLNGEEVRLEDVPASRTLLDFLRLERRLTGTKEGCAEGDCGACTVLVGRLAPNGLVYETVNACIRFLVSVDGCHVVTVEHLSQGGLHPVQRALAKHHGSQCGFCTPGIVMSLHHLWMERPTPSAAEVETALQGNLCRCTGYAPILRAAMTVEGDPVEDPLLAGREEVAARLRDLRDGARVETGPEGDRAILPADAADLAEVLGAAPGATIVAGATDVGLWVTKQMRAISPAVFTAHLDELNRIEARDGGIVIGAGVTYSEMLRVIAERHDWLREFWLRIGGVQVRNMGTVGGNIANGSPIGDTPPPLIVLGAEITLRSGEGRRSLPLEEFFIDYGRQDRRPGEFVESIAIPDPDPADTLAAWKISKRRDEDISALCGAFRLRLSGGRVEAARIAFGGMAATPKRARAAEAALTGEAWDEATVTRAMDALGEDFQPITDWRASAEYRMAAARNLLRRLHLETQGTPARLNRRGAA